MSTAAEVAAQVAATRDHLQRKVDNINKRIARRVDQHKFIMAEAELRAKFNENLEVNYYSWKYQRSFKNHECFTSGAAILLGTKAYKGTRKIKSTMPTAQFYATLYPEEIWLTKEEFTVRRLKGQI